MKRKMALFSVFAILGLSLIQNPTYAHSHHSTGAVIAGTVAGIAAGVMLGSAVSSSNSRYHSYNYAPQRRYRPYHNHRVGCACCKRPVHVNVYQSYEYPGYVNYGWR